jgi:hypothetical protein
MEEPDQVDQAFFIVLFNVLKPQKKMKNALNVP